MRERPEHINTPSPAGRRPSTHGYKYFASPSGVPGRGCGAISSAEALIVWGLDEGQGGRVAMLAAFDVYPPTG